MDKITSQDRIHRNHKSMVSKEDRDCLLEILLSFITVWENGIWIHCGYVWYSETSTHISVENTLKWYLSEGF